MNAELRRYVWTELTPQRVGTLLFLLLLIFWLGAIHPDPRMLPRTALYSAMGLGLMLGTIKVARSMTEELVSRTWDWKRLSLADAGQLAIGKLFGSALLSWVGVALCLAVFLFTESAEGKMSRAVLLLVFTVMLHSLTFLCDVLAVTRPVEVYRGTFLPNVAVIGLALICASYLISRFEYVGGMSGILTWYGTQYSQFNFIVVSILIFSGWAIVGSYRMIRTQLAFHNWPFVYLSFLIFLWLFLCGFDSERVEPVQGEVESPSTSFFSLGTIIFLGAHYISLFTEPPASVVRFRKLFEEVAQRRIGLALLDSPRWVVTLISLVPLAVLSLITARSGAPLTFERLTLSMSLLCIRDTAIFAFIILLPRKRRIDWTLPIAFFVLYALLPWLVMAASVGAPATVSAVFYPQASGSLWPVLVEGSLAWALVVRAFQKTRPGR